MCQGLGKLMKMLLLQELKIFKGQTLQIEAKFRPQFQIEFPCFANLIKIDSSNCQRNFEQYIP